MVTYYIRQGAWCPCERSCDSANFKLEKGVSAFEAVSAAPNKWRAQGLAFEKRARACDRQQRKVLDAVEPWFLVSGTYVGTGYDGEPLLKGVKAHCRLEWDEAQLVVNVGPCDGLQHRRHPQFPDCVCLTPEALVEYEQSLQEDEDIGPEEPIEIEF